VGTKKGPFAEGIPSGLLVPSFAGPVLSGLWANKENDQDCIRKGLGVKTQIVK
jgi:hypothetical protein